MISGFSSVRRSFQAKIIVALVLTMIVMAALFDIVLISIQKKTYRSSQGAHRDGLVRILAYTLRVPVFSENHEDLASSLEGIMHQEYIDEVAVWNVEGELLFSQTKKERELPGIIDNQGGVSMLTSQAIDGEVFMLENRQGFVHGGQVYFSGHPFEEDWYLEERTEPAKEVVGYVAIRFSKATFNAGIRNLFIQTGISVIVFAVIGVFMIFFIIGRVTMPLQELLNRLRSRTKTDPGDSSDIGILSETYDEMVRELEQSFQTIDAMNLGLEEEVADRTCQLQEANHELAGQKQRLEQANTELRAAMANLQKTQEQLIQQEKLAAMGRLVAGVGHELNNTVNFISGAMPSLNRLMKDAKELVECCDELIEAVGTEALMSKAEKIKSIKAELLYEEMFSSIDQLLSNMEEGLRRTTRIINDLRIFSRSSNEKPIALDLHAVIDSTITFLDSGLMEQITIHRKYGELPQVSCLPERMSQVFLNILNNSLQAMEGKGQITIATRCCDGKIRISFADTGCGITAEDIGYIFDPFFTTKEVGKGTGLGLSISYTIVKHHGGDIVVGSNPEGGSVFEIVLPVEPLNADMGIGGYHYEDNGKN